MTRTITFLNSPFQCGLYVCALAGGAIALAVAAINSVAYYFHEQVWNRNSRRSRQTTHLFAQAM